MSSTQPSGTARRTLGAVFAAAALLAVSSGATLAGSSASSLPPEWHIHDGQTTLGPQHKGIGFFPAILTGGDVAAYLQDPASCPNATDKAFLPSAGSSQAALLRAGVCLTSSAVIHLRTVPSGNAGPTGWSVLLGTDGGAWDTYYLVTSR